MLPIRVLMVSLPDKAIFIVNIIPFHMELFQLHTSSYIQYTIPFEREVVGFVSGRGLTEFHAEGKPHSKLYHFDQKL